LIQELLKQGQILEAVEDGIFTTLEADQRGHEYDDKAKGYDALIGSAIYNKLIWGNRLADYRRFCEKALTSRPTGYVLDAGCGSLVFTAEVYAQQTDRPLVLLDRSLGMLRRAKSRLEALNGKMPDHITLVQGDILALPFKAGVFDTVQSFGMLHIFADTAAYIQALQEVKSSEGTIFFNSLVGNTWFGKKYMKFLIKAGEVAISNTSNSLENKLSGMGFDFTSVTIGNMVYFSCYQ